MSSTSPTSPGSSRTIPPTLGRYRILSPLGRGGMSTVYLATAIGPAGFRKLAVLKVLREDLEHDPTFAQMFLDEARLSAQLVHPNVVQTFEVGRDCGFAFMAMEHLEGQPLGHVLRRLRERGLRLPVPLAVHVGARVLEALAYAHRATDLDGRPLGVVHRDVSPENVFLTYEGRVALMDFGVAKAAGASAETRVGTFKGKIAYMPPEQARGDEVDPRADLFATGAVLWEMLAGRRLWHGRTDPVIASELLTERIPNPLSECPDLPAELAHVLRRSLAPRADARYPDADAFRAELEAHAQQTSGAATAQLAATMGVLFEQERRESTLLLRERIRTIDAGEEIPSAALSGMIFGTPTHASDVAHTAVSQALGSVPPVPRNTRRLHRLALSLGVAAILMVVLLVATRAPGLSPPFGNLASRTRGSAGALEPGVPPPPPTTARPPGGCGEGPIVELTGDIEEDATLECGPRYLLRHVTRVRPGATLSIEPGTVILGDPATRGTLVVEARGRLLAIGTPESPIVFTSALPEGRRQAGDWGGVIVLGNAPINLRDAAGRRTDGRVEGLVEGGRYGGNNPDDDSGRIRFVRIEYAGTEIAPNNEVNGLTLAGVGRGTVIDHVQVRETLDDCFEFFGGTVDARYLVCDSPGDDGFDWDQGYTGRLQFLLMRDDPAISDASNGIEGDDGTAGLRGEPRSAPTLYNVTLCGNGGDGPRPSYGILLRHGTAGGIHDAIVSGFHVGFDRRDLDTAGEVRSTLFVANSRFDLGAAERDVGDDTDDDGGFDETRWLLVPHRRNGTDLPGGFDCRRREGAAYKPTTAATEGATAPPHDGFFDARAAYRGAFRDSEDDWDQGAWVVHPG